MIARPERGWAGLAGMAILALGLAWAASRLFEQGESRRKGDRGSIFHAGSSGCRALYLMMRSEGLDARPLTRPVTPGMKKGLLVVIDPGSLGTGANNDLEEWVRDGGALLLASDADIDVAKQWYASIRPGTQAVGLSFAAEGMPRLAMATGQASRVSAAGTGLYERNGDFQVIEVHDTGAGRVIVVSDVWSATNAGIDHADNIFVWLTLARQLAGDRPVWFLETVHGHTNEPSVLEYVSQAGWGPAALQLVLAVAFVLWFFGARPAKALAPSSLVRREAAEYAATMAHLYRRGNATKHAAGIAVEDFQAWLRRPAFARAGTRLGPAERASAENEARQLLESGQDLARRPRPDAGAVYHWLSRVGRYKGRFALADAD